MSVRSEDTIIITVTVIQILGEGEGAERRHVEEEEMHEEVEEDEGVVDDEERGERNADSYSVFSAAQSRLVLQCFIDLQEYL